MTSSITKKTKYTKVQGDGLFLWWWDLRISRTDPIVNESSQRETSEIRYSLVSWTDPLPSSLLRSLKSSIEEPTHYNTLLSRNSEPLQSYDSHTVHYFLLKRVCNQNVLITGFNTSLSVFRTNFYLVVWRSIWIVVLLSVTFNLGPTHVRVPFSITKNLEKPIVFGHSSPYIRGKGWKNRYCL